MDRAVLAHATASRLRGLKNATDLSYEDDTDLS